MKSKSLPLKKRLILIMSFLTLATLISLICSAYYVNTSSQKTQSIIEDSRELTKKLRNIQLNFRIQVQEWKNILLRSHDDVLGKRYRSQFNELREKVNSQITELTEEKVSTDFDKMMKELLKYYTNMQDEYQSALDNFDKNGMSSQATVDSQVRGIDREFNSHIEQLIKEKEEAERHYLFVAKKDIRNTILKGALIFGFIEIIAILIVLKLSVNLLSIATESEEELRKSSENLRITLESIGDAVIATDIKGNVSRMNPVAEKLTGWKIEDAAGKPLPEVFHIVNALTRDEVENPVEKVLATGEIVGLANHTVLIAKNGIEHQIADSGAPIHDLQRNVVGVVLVFRDVTKEYQLQEQLNHSQRMDAIGQLAGGVAHDFNNMIGAILGASEVLEKKLTDDKSRKFHKIIVDCAERAGNLVEKLLAFARKQPESSTKVDVHQVINDSVTILKNTIDKRIEITVKNEADSFMVIGDPSQLESVFINLGINSSHAMANGGTIHIETAVVDLDSHYCEASTFDLMPGKYIQVEFRDSGLGIPHEILAKVFEPFFTTKEQGKGTGLGLSAVYGTIQQHGGAITVYSEENEGTCFSISLPLSSSSGRAKTKVEKIKEGSGRILIVDDEPAMRATAQAILEEIGYDVELAENGQQGLDIYSANHEIFDLVILDMIMPVMNGRDCFHALQEVNKDVKVILTSGFTLEKDLHDMKEKGLSAFVRKPYRSANLSQAVHDAIHQN